MCVFSWGNLQNWSTVLGGAFTVLTFAATVIIAVIAARFNKRSSAEIDRKRNQDLARRNEKNRFVERQWRVSLIREERRDIKSELSAFLLLLGEWQSRAVDSYASIQPALRRFELLVREIRLSHGDIGVTQAFSGVLSGHGFLLTQQKVLDEWDRRIGVSFSGDPRGSQNWVLAEVNSSLDAVKDWVLGGYDPETVTWESDLMSEDFWLASLVRPDSLRGRFVPDRQPPEALFKAAEARWLPEMDSSELKDRVIALIQYRVMLEYSLQWNLARHFDQANGESESPVDYARLGKDARLMVVDMIADRVTNEVCDQIDRLDRALEKLVHQPEAS